MQWTDEGIIIGTRRHGEASLIVELMTRGHGRHLGLVRGGRSRKQQPYLQPGNTVLATWRARLDEHLGNYTIEPMVQRAVRLMEGPGGLYGVQVVAALLRLLPERDPHPALFDGLGPMLDWLGDPLVGGTFIVRFEMKMLEDLGFGLDLDECAVTGNAADLVYVSPKTGRAVSRAAGEIYRDRLLPLPAFLVERGASPNAAEVADAFRLTGYFLARRVFEPRDIELPEARARFLALLARSRPPAEAAE
jgi:DNA repair protein RecO (recombination protein O)